MAVTPAFKQISYRFKQSLILSTTIETIQHSNNKEKLNFKGA